MPVIQSCLIRCFLTVQHTTIALSGDQILGSIVDELAKSKSEEEEDKAFFALHWSVSTGNQHAEKIPACHEKPRCVSSCFRDSMQATLVLEKSTSLLPFSFSQCPVHIFGNKKHSA